MDEISRRTWWLLTAAIMAAVVVVASSYAGELGFWEPWESVSVSVGVDAAGYHGFDDEPGDERDLDGVDESQPDVEDTDTPAAVESLAVPTLSGEPAQISWLKSAWTSFFVDEAPVVEVGNVGEVERRARLLLLLMAVLLLGASAMWVQQYFDEGAAAMTIVVLATSPVFYLGTVFLSGPMIYVAASSLAVMGFFQAVYGAKNQRLFWAAAAGVALAVVALDERLIGVLATLAVVVGLALAEAVGQRNPRGDEENQDSGDTEEHRTPLSLVWVGAAMGLFAATIGWGWHQSSGYDDGFFRPDILQQLWVVAPAILLVGLAMAAQRTPVGRALFGLRGLLLTAGAVIPLVLLGTSYAAAVPVDAQSAHQASPALAYLLENQQFGGDVMAAGDFSWWWRQIGFGLFPHFLFLIPAVGYLVWKLRPSSQTSAEVSAVARLCLVWPVAAFVVVAPAAEFGHTAYPAFFPLTVAIGAMIADGAFWEKLRRRPSTYLAIAVVAVFTLLILTNDLDDFPSRLVEFVLGGTEDPGLADDFAYGPALSLWTKITLVAVIAYFAGAISWMVFAWRDLGRCKRWVINRVRRWRGDEDGVEEPSSESGQDDTSEVDETVAGATPGAKRMAAREAWRDNDGILAQIASRLERLPGLVGLVALMGLGFTVLHFVSFVDDLDDTFSSRAVVEQYLQSATDGEDLWRYQIGEEPTHFYVRGLENLSNRRDFNEQYEREERFFALIPKENLARIHSRVRRDHEENLVVLAGGGQMYLVSNRLADGEIDVNPISEYILDEPDEDIIELVFEVDGEKQHLEFDRQLEFLGYRLDRGSHDERAVYRWGDTMEITQYFRVKRRIPRSQEIFMHIDFGGNRIHGDHDPVGGLYPTNHWLAGDIIKDVHEVEIDRFTAPGTYTIWTGFYRSDDRMSVRPASAHDGEDRVEMTTIEIVAF